MSINQNRRNLLKTTGAVFAIAALNTLPRTACAKTNPELRAKLKYVDKPHGEENCLSCLEFIAGKTEKDLGGCQVIPGDDEISPNAWCISWNTM
jgi:hypothetical protein